MKFGVIMFIIIGIMIIYCLLGCQQKTIPHPPTFQHIFRAKFFYDENFTEAEFAYNQKLEAALDYLPDEIDQLLQQHKIEYLIGVAYQAHDQRAIQLLSQEIALVKSDNMALTYFITRQIRQEQFQLPENIEELLHLLIINDATNSVPYYFTAYYYMRQQNVDQSLYYVTLGNQQKRFQNYFQERAQACINSSLFVGYSPIAAYYIALYQPDEMMYLKLAKYLLQTSPYEETFNQCRIMGEVIKKQSLTFMCELFAIAIQRKALENLVGNHAELKDDLDQLLQERQHISDTIQEFEHTIRSFNITEQRWLRYYEDLYTISEQEAMNRLIAEYSKEK